MRTSEKEVIPARACDRPTASSSISVYAAFGDLHEIFAHKLVMQAARKCFRLVLQPHEAMVVSCDYPQVHNETLQPALVNAGFLIV